MNGGAVCSAKHAQALACAGVAFTQIAAKDIGYGVAVAVESAIECPRTACRVHADRHPAVFSHVDVGGEGDRFAAHVVNRTVVQTVYVRDEPSQPFFVADGYVARTIDGEAVIWNEAKTRHLSHPGVGRKVDEVGIIGRLEIICPEFGITVTVFKNDI